MRSVKLTTVLDGKLRFRRMTGEEALSCPFHFELELTSDDGAIGFTDVLGTPMTVEVPLADGQKRWFHGLVSRFAFTGHEGDEARYAATLRPWLWFLDRSTDCRIFQEQSVPEIVRTIFQKHAGSGAEVEERLSGNYAPRVYCVQYRESDLDFIDRLLQDEGITYFFTHAADRHTLVLADSPEAHQSAPGYEEVPYFPKDAFARRERDHVFLWDARAEVRSGSFVHQSFDFKKSRADLTTRSEQPMAHALAEGERYDYTGDYTELDAGDRTARLRLEAEQAEHQGACGEGTAAGLAAGHRFKLARYPREDQNAEYLLRQVEHEIWDPAYRSGVEAGQDIELSRCRFVAMPADVPYRPPLTAPRPLVHGPQTAIVTGPAGEEIWTDKYGRVKVQFPWDREGKRDEKTSCWVRVSQPWAGAGFGAMMIPRIGQEVIVDFLEGDPDRPIITGRVYNAQAMPPYPLPAAAAQSGLKSNSTKGGGGSNELTFDDSKGKEKVTLHAQHDMSSTVEHDQTNTVRNDMVTMVGHDQTNTIKNHRKTTVVEGDDTLGVSTGKRTVTVKGDSTHNVTSGSRTVTVETGSYIGVAKQTVFLHGQTKGVGLRGDGEGVSVVGNGKGVSITGNAEGVGIIGNGQGVHITGNTKGVTIDGRPVVHAQGEKEAILIAPKVSIGDDEITISGKKITLEVNDHSVVIDSSGVTIRGTLSRIN